MNKLNRFMPIFILVVLLGSNNISGKDSEVRKLQEVDGIVLLGSGDVTVTLGNKEEITVYAPEELIPYLRTEVEDGTLYIGKRKRGWKKFKFFNEKVRYNLVVKSLKNISITGSGDVIAEKLSSNFSTISVTGSGDIDVNQLLSKNADIKVTGSGDIDINNNSADVLGVAIHGSGDVSIRGKTDELDVAIHGSGTFDGNELRADEVVVNIHGSGDADIWAIDRLNVHLTGSGDVIFRGDPSIRSKSTGSGSVNHR